MFIPVITVEDISTTINFYSYVLGFTVVKQTGDGEYQSSATLGKDGGLLHFETIHPQDSKEYDHSGGITYSGFGLIIPVEDIEDYFAFIHHTVQVTKNIHEGPDQKKQFCIMDINGVKLTFRSMV